MAEYTIDVNKLAIIIFVGIFAICGLFLGEHDLTTFCLGGLIGYLSKEYNTTKNNENEEVHVDKTPKKEVIIPEHEEDEDEESA